MIRLSFESFSFKGPIDDGSDDEDVTTGAYLTLACQLQRDRKCAAWVDGWGTAVRHWIPVTFCPHSDLWYLASWDQTKCLVFKLSDIKLIFQL